MGTTSPLSRLPDLKDGLGGYGLPSIIYSMQETGFRSWGFRIYRCTYDDDDSWKSYIAKLEDNITKSLKAYGSDYLLLPYHAWTIVEDREALDGASKEDVRSQFREWSEARFVERNGPGTDAGLCRTV